MYKFGKDDRITHKNYPHQEGVILFCLNNFDDVPGLVYFVGWLEGTNHFGPSGPYVPDDMKLLVRGRKKGAS